MMSESEQKAMLEQIREHAFERSRPLVEDVFKQIRSLLKTIGIDPDEAVFKLNVRAKKIGSPVKSEVDLDVMLLDLEDIAVNECAFALKEKLLAECAKAINGALK